MSFLNIGKHSIKNLLNILRNSIIKTHAFKTTIKLQISKPKLLIGTTLSGVSYYNKDNLARLKDLQFSDLFKSVLGLFIKFAECEAKKKRRTDSYEKTINTKGDKIKDEEVFDWKEFFRMIYDEKFYFLAAIIVS